MFASGSPFVISKVRDCGLLVLFAASGVEEGLVSSLNKRMMTSLVSFFFLPRNLSFFEKNEGVGSRWKK